MSCSECTKANPVNHCTTNLVIGTATADTDYIVQFTNTATGRTDSFEITSDLTGIISVIVSDLDPIYNASYEIRVYDTDGVQVTLTIAATEYCCITLPFNNQNLTTTSQTISFIQCATS